MILEFLTEHESALTYDFQSVHHCRLSDTVLTRTSAELLDLVMWLPDDSAFRASLEAKGDTSKALHLHGWGARMELLLATVNVLLDQTYVLVQANSKGKIPPPEHVAGPRTEKKPKKKSSDANSIAFAMMRTG